jgi:hypothetical protein
MGDFRIQIEATGGHGCDRLAKVGERVAPCMRMGCPDCELRRFLSSPQFLGMVKSARLGHWPGQESEVVDEFKPAKDGAYLIATRVKGSFGG